ncbi:MAG: efflux RND transporter periplasmic adaptor subunit [Candidatus Aminicenantales bacterium]
MKKKIIIGAVILIIITGLILAFVLFKNHKNSSVKYKKEAVARGDIEALVVTSGTLNPVNVVDVGSQVSGKIARLYVDFNSLVTKGQIVAELEKDILEARVEQNDANYQSAVAALEKARVTLENLKKKYERSLDLFNKNLISFEEKETAEAQYFGAKADLQSSEARVIQAKSQLESSKVDLGYAIIRSPIDGIVISRNINVGQTVAASFQAPVLFQIANDLSKMQVECNVDEADIGKVKEGQKVRFNVDAFQGETFTGAVRQVRYSPEVVQNVVTYTTIVDVENPEMKLRPGMTATVSIIIGEAKNVLRIPNAALRFTPNLTPEEMAIIFNEVRERMIAGRQGTSPEGGTGQPGASQTPGGQRPSGGFSPEMMARFQRSGQGGGMRQASRIWIQDEQGKIILVFLRTGVTDNTFTEVIRGEIKEGQLVITGEDSRSGNPSSSSSGSRDVRRNVMFIGR